MADSKLGCRAAVLASAVVPLFAAPALAGPAMATADGFGSNVTGGGGVGDVYHVTTLASDPTGVLPGSLRYGLLRKNMPTISSNVYGKRTIVFDVGGTLDLGGTTLDIKDVSNVTIAGQTAPSPVVITGNTTQITGSSTNNVIFQYLTIRNPSAGEDSLSIKGGGPTTNILADHISTSWGKDEQISVTQGATNVTVQNSFATEALDSASHAYGALIRPDNNNANVSYLKNLFANNRSRNPRPGSYDGTNLNFDFRNNTIYNYSDRAGYSGGEGGDVVTMNYVGNYVIAGPYTTSAAKNTAFTVDMSGDGVVLNAYQSGNLVDGNGWGATLPGLKNTTSAGKVTYGKDAVRDGVDLGWAAFTALTGGSGSFTQSGSSVLTVPTKFAVDALTAHEQVLAGGGNFAWARDATDARLVAQLKAGTGDVMNAAPAAELAAVNAGITPANWITRAAGYDTDNDGLPNAWETQHGLNPNSTTAKLVFNSVTQKVTTANSGFEGWTGGESNVVSPNGYSWLEVYLSELGLQATHAGGAWDAILSWNGVRPDSVGATATFNGGASPEAVAVNAVRKIGQLNLRGTGGYTLSGTGGLTTQVVAGYAMVNVSGGAHTLALPLTLASDTHVTVDSGAALDVTGSLNAAGRVVTKNGAGTLTANNVRAAGLNVTGGVVRIRPGATPNLIAGTSALGALGIAAGSQLDLTNNALVLTYSAGNGAVTTTGVRGLLAAGKLTSSTATATVGLGYGDNGAGEVQVRTTLFGDTDLDGGVSINDFNALAANFGQSSGKLWLDGDFDYDGGVSINDFNRLAANFGQTLGGPAVAANFAPLLAFAAAHNDLAAFEAVTGVPEPGMLGVAAVGAVLGLRRRRA